MAITLVGNALSRSIVRDVPDGRLFLYDNHNVTLLCMNSRAEGSSLVVVMGGVGPGDKAPGWMVMEAVEDHEVYTLPEDLTLEVIAEDGAQFGLPQPRKDAPVGSIDIRENGAAYISAQNKGHGRGYFRVGTGERAGGALSPSYYLRWRLTWQKPGQKEPVVIYQHG